MSMSVYARQKITVTSCSSNCSSKPLPPPLRLLLRFHPQGVSPSQVTNAISGIIVVGGMLQLSGPVLSARVGCALAAVFLSSVNIVGGFAVTARMLEMFREDAKPRTPASAGR